MPPGWDKVEFFWLTVHTAPHTATPHRRRIRRLLLAGNPYQAFLLEEAGFSGPGAPPRGAAPSFDLVRSGYSACRQLDEGQYDMLLTDDTLQDMTGAELARRVREEHPDLPVVIITSNPDLGVVSDEEIPPDQPNLFVWYGAPSMLRALVKLQEDELNAPALAGGEHFMLILLVEDEPNFYSHYLPVLYDMIRDSAISRLPDDRRPTDPWALIDNRPLVLLRRTFEEACQVLFRYRTQLMALLTDIRFPVDGRLKGDAGLRLLYRARAINGHLPVAVHSRDREHRKAVHAAQAKFLAKDSPRLLVELEQFLTTYCGFGPFVFRWPAGDRYGTARTMEELRELIVHVPDVVFEHHALHFDFSSWLAVHGHQDLARQVRELSIIAADPRRDLLLLLDRELAARQSPASSE